MTIIKTENLTYTYGSGTPFAKTAVDNVNIEIEEGELVGLIGHTGSGKSTLIQHFNGLLKPSSGKVFVDGEDIWKNKETTRKTRFKVGLVFQYPEYQLFEDTVYKDIAFGPKNMGLSAAEIDERIKETAAEIGLTEELLSKSPYDLSGGQKRRVAIAGIMAMRPKVLILDEPTAGLDPHGRDSVFKMIKNYHERMKSTVILVSHSMEDVACYAGKILVMNKSGVFCYDETKAVFSRSDEISALGLDVPQITRIFNKLKEKGYFKEKQVFTVEYALQLLINKS